MLIHDEKTGFTERLKQAFMRAANKIPSASELATQFNLRHPNDPITPQAAQKWLTGRAKPTPDKLQTLADWLDVPLHWLSYGSPEPVNRKSTMATRRHPENRQEDLSRQEWQLIEKVRCLTAQQQSLIYEITDAFTLERNLLPPEHNNN